MSKPTSKVIKTFMINHEWTRAGGSGQYGFHCDSSEEEANYLIAHCEDGSIWRTKQDIMWTERDGEDDDWECILEAPEPETKKMVANFLLVGDDRVDYFIRNGWEIVSSAPNPQPCPYIFFSIRKYFEKRLTKKEVAILREKASLDFFHNDRDGGDLFWEGVHKEAAAEFLAELNQSKE